MLTVVLIVVGTLVVLFVVANAMELAVAVATESRRRRGGDGTDFGVGDCSEALTDSAAAGSDGADRTTAAASTAETSTAEIAAAGDAMVVTAAGAGGTVIERK